MKRSIVIFALTYVLFALSNCLFAQSEYDLLWGKVDEVSEKGRAKTAYGLVSEIYDKAVQEENSEQIVKALIHQIGFSGQ